MGLNSIALASKYSYLDKDKYGPIAKLVNTFADVEERKNKRGKLDSHTSNKLDTEAYALVGLDKSVYKEE